MEHPSHIPYILPGSRGFSHDHSVARNSCPLQFVKVFDDARPQRIEMNIADQFEKIWFIFTEKGFISVLVRMAVTSVAPVELLGISGEYPSHYSR
jgi:hypothetical protein